MYVKPIIVNLCIVIRIRVRSGLRSLFLSDSFQKIKSNDEYIHRKLKILKFVIFSLIFDTYVQSLVLVFRVLELVRNYRI